MSSQAKRDLDDAVRAFITNNNGTVTDWVLFTASIAEDCEDDERYYTSIVRDGQPTHATLGLVQRQAMALNRDAMTPSDD